ncbi:glycosyltransferase family 39 protein [Geitlerinema sp. PCC 9228]|uniref:glycosyltransferase family 39 protein n=1 Tax=Geitlerinema sp. PCC 9228 TaxID=111611 RepID=UPI0008F9D519|nr:glycosyltransferase family 39 protein [Geitlerinema sp. PCC 9228]
MGKNLFTNAFAHKRSLEIFSSIAIAVGVMWRMANLQSREYWYDEILSVIFCTGQRIAYESPGSEPVSLAQYASYLQLPPDTSLVDAINTLKDVLKGVTTNQHAPLFYVLQHFWLRLFGNDEAATRSLVVLFGIAAIALAYFVGRKLLSHRGGLLFAALLATNPFFLSHSLKFRMHGYMPFWALLSTLALITLIELRQASPAQNDSQRPYFLYQGVWSVVFVGSVTAGLLTNYLFAYIALGLSVLVLVLDRRHWWYYAIEMLLAALLTTPWIWWGVRRQIRNASWVLDQFGAGEGENVALQHLQGLANNLSAQLVVGDWFESLSDAAVVAIGTVTGMLLVAMWWGWWRQTKNSTGSRDRKPLAVALLIGVFPLFLGFFVDVFAGQFTIGWGGGRGLSFILPGMLLAIAWWLERAAGRWQQMAAVGLLLLYLGIGIGDYTLRQRQTFHAIAATVEQTPNTDTLIIMNSRAWGHILRLAYYVWPSPSLQLLARPPADLASNLETVLANSETTYPRIVWLEAEREVWEMPQNEAQAQQFRQQVRSVLENQAYTLEQTQQTQGTMILDEFTITSWRS